MRHDHTVPLLTVSRQARQRCWRYAWVTDLDIQGFLHCALKAESPRHPTPQGVGQ
jgi:hypothetical protein